MITQERQRWEPDQTDIERLLSGLRPETARILEKPFQDRDITPEEGERLFFARANELEALLRVADALRRQAVGDEVSFVINRNINFTNVCHMGCRFCNFRRRIDDPDAEWLSFEEVAQRAEDAWNRGATEVCIQGGLHPDLQGDDYRNILRAIKARVPDMHIHAFSPYEIWYGAKKDRRTPEDFIRNLKEHGLGSIPGTAAEILDVEVRRILTRNKLSADEWEHIIRAAHAAGVPTTATIMYGHVDEPRHWAHHIARIRAIQKDTGGFTEFVPLGFIHQNSPIFISGEARPGPTYSEHIRMHAVARLMLNGWIDNLQVSWVKMGPRLAQEALSYGANDLGGTLMNERISRAAGAPYGEEITPAEMVRMIRGAGRRPVRRNTAYEVMEAYDDHDPGICAPLVDRDDAQARTLGAVTGVRPAVIKEQLLFQSNNRKGIP